MGTSKSIDAYDWARSLVLGFPGPALVADNTGVILECNRAARGVLTVHADGVAALRGDLPRRVGILAVSRKPDRWAVTIEGKAGDPPMSFLLAGIPIEAEPAREPVVALMAWETTVETHLRTALAESRSFFRDLATTCGEFVWSIDREGIFNYASDTGLTGLSSTQLHGRHWSSLFQGDNERATAAKIFESRASVDEADIWLKLRDSRVCLRLSVRPSFEGDGKWVGARGVARNITRQREEQERVARWRESEARLNGVMRHFREQVEPSEMLRCATTAVVGAANLTGCWIYIRKQGQPFDLDTASTLHVVPKRYSEESLAQSATVLHALAGQVSDGDGEKTAQCSQGDWSYLAKTARYGGNLLGVLCFGRVREGAGAEHDLDANVWDDIDKHFISQLSDQVAIAIVQTEQHEQLRRLSSTDELTGLLNRRAFVAEVRKRLDHHARKKSRAALLFIDLDGFKAINDTEGHRRGDEVLEAVAGLIQSTSRSSDISVRYGGDEFGLWLEEADETVAMLKAHDLIEGCMDLNGKGPANEADVRHLPVGMSIGIAVYDPDEPEDIESLLNRADTALYEAKASGKSAFRLAKQPVEIKSEHGAGGGPGALQEEQHNSGLGRP